MSYIYIPYDSIDQLVERVQSVDLIRDAVPLGQSDPAPPNFVLIDPFLYYGTFGGLVYDTVLPSQNISFLCSSVGHGLSVLWWPTTLHPPFVGDVYALAAHGRVAIPTSLFDRLRVNTVRKPSSTPKSNYFGPKAWRINDASSSYSSSE